MTTDCILLLLLSITLTPLAVMDQMARRVDPATLMLALGAVLVLSLQSWGMIGKPVPVVLSTPLGPLDTPLYRFAPQWGQLTAVSLLPTLSFVLRLMGRPLTSDATVDVPFADYAMLFLIGISKFGWMVLAVAIITSLIHSTRTKSVPYLTHLWLASVATMLFSLAAL